jgi:transcriptional regulator with XRE-family HTH domain
MIASLVKEGRIAKGYTQKELSELSNISIRSIQRIENAEILPRSYTLKTLAGILGISFETFQQAEPVRKGFTKINRNQKIILSAGISLFIFFLAWAFLAQSSNFPETEFELIIFSAIVLLLITSLLAIIWRSKS